MKFFKTVIIGDSKTKELEKGLIHLLEKEGYIQNNENFDFIISIGGDGTFLRTVQDYYVRDPLFISINMGNLGYLCEFEGNEIDKVVKLLKNPLIKEISLLEGNYENENFYALNEIRVEATHGSSIKFDVKINDTFLETIKGDGCLVSTSIGSSGLARSLGGSLVDNEIEMLEFVEKAPIENKTYQSIRSPFVLNKEKVISICNINDKFAIAYDCKYKEFEKMNGDITIKLSNKKIRILKNAESNYILKTRRAFLG